MILLGAILERVFFRPMIGEPHFAVLMLTIGLGFVLERSLEQFGAASLRLWLHLTLGWCFVWVNW